MKKSLFVCFILVALLAPPPCLLRVVEKYPAQKSVSWVL